MPEHRAQPPRPPAPSRALRDQRDKHQTQKTLRERREHNSLLRGLFFFALVAVVVSIARAGLHRAFVPGWWQQW